MILRDIMLVKGIDSMTHIPDINPEIKKTLTSHTTKSEEDHIIEDNKLIKT